MRNRMKRSLLLVLSCASLVSTVGYASWILPSQKEYSINNRDTQSKPVAYIVGKEKIKYTSIEKALDVAKSGDIVLVIPPTDSNYHSTNNNITPNKVTYHISRDCEIKTGVSLVIPTESSACAGITNANTLEQFIKSMSNDDRNRGGNYSKIASDDSSHYLRVTIEVDDNVTVKNSGNLVISGYLSGGSATSGPIGRTSHSYSQILLGKNSRIVQSEKSSNTYCFGFIAEKSAKNGSEINIDQGKLYVPLVIYDYRGFTFSVALTGGALSKEHCSPFNQFGIENVSVLTTVQYAASVIGVSNLYVKYGDDVQKNFYNEVTLVGNSTGSFIQFSDENNSSLAAYFSVSKQLMDLEIIGGINLNNINLQLKATNTMSISFSTVESFLPITNMYNITLLRAKNQIQAKFNFSKQRLKLLPGSKLTIEDGCSISSSDFVVYSAFYDGTIGNGETADNEYDSVKYPLLEGATLIVKGSSVIDATSFGGIVYSDNSSCVSAASNSCISKEAWNLKSSGKLNPPWTIDDYLEIREKTSIVPSTYLNKKKIFCGMNTFTENSSNLPSYDINLGDSSVSFSGYQGVVFIDQDKDYRIVLNANIYNAYCGSRVYPMDSIISSNNVNIVGAINSGLPISSNNNGKNEFHVQSIQVTCATPLVNGEVPLYVNSAIQLRATIDDANKAYDKVVKWTSSDTSIATVDSTGKVTGKKLGVVTIYAECGGVVGTFETKVISSAEIVPISSITLTDSKNDTATMNVSGGASQTFGSFNSSNKYGNNQSIDLTLKLNDGAKWASIEWTLTASKVGRQYINDSAKLNNTVQDVETIKVHTGSGTGKDDDGFTLSVKVTELGTGKTYTMVLQLIHKADLCFASGTRILLSNGTYKNIEDLTYADKIMTWNFFESKYEAESIAILVDHGKKKCEIMDLVFSDGTRLSVVGSHGLFDYDLNDFVYLTPENCSRYINHRFVKNNFDKTELVRLKSTNTYLKTTHAYSLTSAHNYNAVANSILTSPPPGEFYNWIPMNGKMRYDVKRFKADVEKYGLFDYSVFEPYGISYETFMAFNGQYLKIPVEKGIFQFEYIIELFDTYKRWI